MRLRVTASILSLLTIFMACEESQEGCLDLLAENYNFEAVTECEDCCTYPSATLNFSFINTDSLSYSLGDTLLNVEGDSMILESFKLLFSDFTFKANSQDYTIRDTIEFLDSKVYDDFIYMERESSYSIGATRIQDTINTILFTVGLDEALAESLKPFEDIDQSSQLDLALDSMYVDSIALYRFFQMELQFVQDSSFVKLDFPNSLQDTFQFASSIVVGDGQDWSFNLELDVHALLSDLIREDDNSIIIEKVNNNFRQSIRLK